MEELYAFDANKPEIGNIRETIVLMMILYNLFKILIL